MLKKSFYKLAAVLFFTCCLINIANSATPLPGDEDIQRINALIGGAQSVLGRAAALGVHGRGAGESVMIVGGEAHKHVPGLLSILPLFGITDADTSRLQLKEGSATAITWYVTLVRESVFDRGVFELGKLINGLSKADDLLTEGGINPKILMTTVYNLVRFLYERGHANPHRIAAVRDLAFSYFDKLNEQDTQCCRGAIGRTFHVLILACTYLLDQHVADAERRRVVEAPVMAAAASDLEDKAARMEEFATQQQERFCQQIQVLLREETNQRDLMWIAFSDKESPELAIHPGASGISQLFLSYKRQRDRDGHTANRLYNEEGQKREAEILAARQREEAAVKERERLAARVLDEMKARLKDAEDAVFAPASLFHDCRTQALRDTKGAIPTHEVQLRAFDLFEEKNPALKVHIDLLRGAHKIIHDHGFTVGWYRPEVVDSRAQERLRQEYLISKLVS